MITDEELARVPHLELLKRSAWNSLVKELQIRRKLQEYVGHKIGCDGFKCTCGLEPLLAKLKELEA